jgi:hypothetical protein
MLNIGDGKTATKMALESTQVDVKHTQTASCEGKFLNLCLSMGKRERVVIMAAGPPYDGVMFSV